MLFGFLKQNFILNVYNLLTTSDKNCYIYQKLFRNLRKWVELGEPLKYAIHMDEKFSDSIIYFKQFTLNAELCEFQMNEVMLGIVEIETMLI